MTRRIAGLALGALLGVGGPARAADLHRCEARLSLPAGEAVIAGYGPTGAAARVRARRAASTLASHHAHAELIAGLLVHPGAALGRALTWLEQAPQGEGPAPGYLVVDGDCSASPLPRNRDGAWVATWPVAQERVLRNDPGLALEGARRRACYGRYQQQAQRILHGAAQAPEADRWRVGVTALGDSRDALVRCLTQAAPEVQPAGAPLPGPETGGLVACFRPRKAEDRWATAPGFGPTLEEAREAALARDLLVVGRQAAGEALAALTEGEEGLTDRVLAAADPLRTLVVGSDVVEQALTLCRAGAAKRARVEWRAPEACGRDTSRHIPGAPEALEGMVGARCDAVLRGGTDRALAALAGDRAADGGLAAEGLATALACAASCGQDLDLQGWAGAPVMRPGEIARADGEAAASALARAIDRRDLDALGVLTGGVLLDPRYAGTARHDPEGYWGSLKEALRSGRLARTAGWEEVEGHWLLTFR